MNGKGASDVRQLVRLSAARDGHELMAQADTENRKLWASRKKLFDVGDCHLAARVCRSCWEKVRV